MYDPDQFIAEADEIAARGYSSGAVGSIERLLRRLAAEWSGFDSDGLTALHGEAAGASILARGTRGSVLMLARFSAEAPTPVHDHNSWGVVYVLRGRDRYERWRRRREGAAAGVSMIEELQLGEGDSVSFPPPPDDLHAQQGVDGPAWELVFFASDPNRRARTYFEPATGTVEQREAMS